MHASHPLCQFCLPGSSWRKVMMRAQAWGLVQKQGGGEWVVVLCCWGCLCKERTGGRKGPSQAQQAPVSQAFWGRQAQESEIGYQ